RPWSFVSRRFLRCRLLGRLFFRNFLDLLGHRFSRQRRRRREQGHRDDAHADHPRPQPSDRPHTFRLLRPDSSGSAGGSTHPDAGTEALPPPAHRELAAAGRPGSFCQSTLQSTHRPCIQSASSLKAPRPEPVTAEPGPSAARQSESSKGGSSGTSLPRSSNSNHSTGSRRGSLLSWTVPMTFTWFSKNVESVRSTRGSSAVPAGSRRLTPLCQPRNT